MEGGEGDHAQIHPAHARKRGKYLSAPLWRYCSFRFIPQRMQQPNCLCTSLTSELLLYSFSSPYQHTAHRFQILWTTMPPFSASLASLVSLHMAPSYGPEGFRLVSRGGWTCVFCYAVMFCLGIWLGSASLCHDKLTASFHWPAPLFVFLCPTSSGMCHQTPFLVRGWGLGRRHLS